MESLVTLGTTFLPMTLEECEKNTVFDFVYVTGDAYVDHPSFGTAIIGRILQDAGFSVGIIAQPDYHTSYRDGSQKGVCLFGRPRLGFLVSAGNMDSMVAHYTAAKKKRSEDYYTPKKQIGKRPDRATIVYCKRIREAYGDVPIIIGGVEASLRRFAHYDYWDNTVHPSILMESTADLLSYGMGEKSIPEIARMLDKGIPVHKIRNIRGTCYVCASTDKIQFPSVDTGTFEALANDKVAYADAFRVQYENQGCIAGKAIVEHYGERIMVQNPPQPLLTRKEMDEVYALPYCRTWHPSYDKDGGIPALEEVEFSITHNRGCFGSCAFCSIAFHQGRNVVSRSKESVLAEAQLLTTLPRFKGYIHDVGGPTANFRYGPCKAVREGKKDICPTRRCLSPTPCKNLICDHAEYIELLEELRKIPKIKKVFVRSGVRFDYAVYDKSDKFIETLVTHHVSGQLKTAPEHISPNVLRYMGKPDIQVYERFCDKYFAYSKKAGKEQYIVPYLMSSHPGSTLEDAIDLALYLKKHRIRPEQVQDFYPTPGTAATTMYYTGIDPFTGKEVRTAKGYEHKKMQRALLQSSRPENRELVRKAIFMTGRNDAFELLGGHTSAEKDASSQKAPKRNTSKPMDSRRKNVKGTSSRKPFDNDKRKPSRDAKSRKYAEKTENRPQNGRQKMTKRASDSSYKKRTHR